MTRHYLPRPTEPLFLNDDDEEWHAPLRTTRRRSLIAAALCLAAYLAHLLPGA